MYEDWERADGAYTMTCPKPLEPVADRTPAFYSSGKPVHIIFPDSLTPPPPFLPPPTIFYSAWKDTTDGIPSLLSLLFCVVLALSNLKIHSDAKAIHRGGPCVYTIADDLRLGNRMGLLFVTPHQGLSAQRTAGCRLLFYVVAGKVLVNMRLDGRGGGPMARFGVCKGGTWEVPCDSMYRMANGLATPAQLVLWLYDVAAGDGGGGRRRQKWRRGLGNEATAISREELRILGGISEPGGRRGREGIFLFLRFSYD
jgi:hypothetical protein